MAFEREAKTMNKVKMLTGHEIPLDGDLLYMLESLYREVSLKRELKALKQIAVALESGSATQELACLVLKGIQEGVGFDRDHARSLLACNAWNLPRCSGDG